MLACVSMTRSLFIIRSLLALTVCMSPRRSHRGESVASGAKQTLPTVSSFHVLRVPAREQPGRGDPTHCADGGCEGGTQL